MTAAIHDILQESRDYYRSLKQELVGRLLVNATGTLISKSICGKYYLYLRRISHNMRIDTYIGHHKSVIAEIISKELSQRKKHISSIRSVKKAMKDLHIGKKELTNQDYTKSLRDIFEKFANEGLWDDGLQLIGSWCFKVFQSNFGVEFYPERTLDAYSDPS
ncbi:nucleotidyltransferase family protein [Desulfomicrobium salsuginis]